MDGALETAERERKLGRWDDAVEYRYGYRIVGSAVVTRGGRGRGL